MCIENRKLSWTLMLLFKTGVLCNPWKVVYEQRPICAVEGSSVVIPCSFYYPEQLRVQRVMWSFTASHRVLLMSDRDAKKEDTRIWYIGNKKHNCSLKIKQVKHRDRGNYTFRFTTNSRHGKWTGRVGSTLTVVDLNISVTTPNGNRTVKEGDSVNLTCFNGCDGGNLSSAFLWFKDGELANEGPVLYLSNITSTSSGNYTCSLKTHPGTTSGVLNIDVEYGPRNTSASVRPSDAGSNITLICSSHANPPVENYTWFKIDGEDVRHVGHQPLFFPDDGGHYLCRATNKHGSQNSSVVTLQTKSDWATFTRDVLIIAAAVLPVIVIIVIVVRRLHKNRTSTPRTEEDTQGRGGERQIKPTSYVPAERQNTDYVNWLPCDQSQEAFQCEEADTEVIYTTVHFNNKRESNMEQQMDSRTFEDVIYISVCRNQQLNPSHIELPEEHGTTYRCADMF